MRDLILLGILWVPAGLLPGASVNAVGFSFSPNSLTITAGDTVQWNSLQPNHNVAASNAPSDTAWNGDASFYSGAINAVPSYSKQFLVAGTFNYLCEAHAGLGMRGVIFVVAPSPTATPCATATESPSSSASPSVTQSPTLTATPNPSFSPTDSPTLTLSFTVSPSPSVSPSATGSASPSPSQTLSPVLSVTVTPTLLLQSFAGVEDARLLASPITDGLLRVWARLDGAADAAELRVYSGACTLMLAQPLGSQQPGAVRWVVPLTGIGPQPIWVQLRVQEAGRWRQGPVLRSYVLR